MATWPSWSHAGWQGEHCDLWNLLAEELRCRVAPVRVSWVMGHATRLDVLRGRTTQEDKEGNDGADTLAVAGAKEHVTPPEVVLAYKQRRDQAVQVQRMMVAILQARFEAEHWEPDAAGNDRGSDVDECMESLDDFDAEPAPDDGEGDDVHLCDDPVNDMDMHGSVDIVHNCTELLEDDFDCGF